MFIATYYCTRTFYLHINNTICLRTLTMYITDDDNNTSLEMYIYIEHVIGISNVYINGKLRYVIDFCNARM